MDAYLQKLVSKYPDLAACAPDVQRAYTLLLKTFQGGGKLLLCGNGGSAADCEHIVGELMKGYLRPRPLTDAMRQRLLDASLDNGAYLADHLQGALPAISLTSQTALLTATANDTAADMIFAQQVYGYGRPGDAVLGISTSGNSRNVVQALQVGRALELRTVGLAGQTGGALSAICDVTICVPWTETADVQERHLAIYHALCAMLEAAFW